MRLEQIINESFSWDSEWDSDMYRSLKGLVNKNNGVWKSKKQRDFMLKRAAQANQGLSRDPNSAQEMFGVDMTSDQELVLLSATTRWAEYGSRSVVPVRYAFVVDRRGVEKFYKLGNKGNLRDGSAPDPSKNKLEFVRPQDVDVSHLAKSEEEKKKEFKTALGMSDGEYVGEPGKRQDFGTLELVAKKFVDYSHFGYNMATEKYWNLYKDEKGRFIVHVGKEGPERGEKIRIVATVKDHYVSKKGDKQTKIIRPRFYNVETNEEIIHEDTASDNGIYTGPSGRDVAHYALIRLDRSRWLVQEVAKSNPERKFNSPVIVSTKSARQTMKYGNRVGDVPEKLLSMVDKLAAKAVDRTNEQIK